MFEPLMPVTVNVVLVLALLMLPLVMLHVPLPSVVQPSPLPPNVKSPVTVASGTATPEASRTLTVAVPRHPLVVATALPLSAPTDTVWTDGVETVTVRLVGVVCRLALSSTARARMVAVPEAVGVQV